MAPPFDRGGGRLVPPTGLTKQGATCMEYLGGVRASVAEQHLIPTTIFARCSSIIAEAFGQSILRRQNSGIAPTTQNRRSAPGSPFLVFLRIEREESDIEHPPTD